MKPANGLARLARSHLKKSIGISDFVCMEQVSPLREITLKISKILAGGMNSFPYEYPQRGYQDENIFTVSMLSMLLMHSVSLQRVCASFGPCLISVLVSGMDLVLANS